MEERLQKILAAAGIAAAASAIMVNFPEVLWGNNCFMSIISSFILFGKNRGLWCKGFCKSSKKFSQLQ